MSKVRRNFMIGKKDDEWLNKLKEDETMDKSFVVRRALKFYRAEGYKRDKIFQRVKDGEM